MITVAALVYRDTRWIYWLLESLEAAHTNVKWKKFIVANDPLPEVRTDPVVDAVFDNDNLSEFYINRVYRAWNYAVERATTDQVVLLNSDMYVSNWWLDELVAVKTHEPMSLPCSLLVESGRLDSAMPEYAHDMGNPVKGTFNSDEWHHHASIVRQRGRTEPGRLFMPALFDRKAFLAAGGYPEGNPAGISGDKILFTKLQAMGYEWLTCLGSVVYHVQEGEQRE